MPLNFDHVAFFYDRFMHPFERGFLSEWRKKLWKGLKGERVLEIGVGTGANFPYYPEGVGIVGLDKSRNMLMRAKSKGNHPLVLGDVERLPFKDATFDAVVSTLVFCSLSDPLKGLLEVKRVLREGGLFYMLEHVRPRGWKGRVFDLLNPITVFILEEHINRDLMVYFKRSGFDVLKAEDLTGDGLFRHFVLGKRGRRV